MDKQEKTGLIIGGSILGLLILYELFVAPKSTTTTTLTPGQQASLAAAKLNASAAQANLTASQSPAALITSGTVALTTAANIASSLSSGSSTDDTDTTDYTDYSDYSS